MKFLSGSIVARIAGAALLAAGLTSAAQTTTTQVRTVRSQAPGAGKPAPAATVQIAPNGTRYKKVGGQSSPAAAKTQTVKATIVRAPAASATSKSSAVKAQLRPKPHFAPAPTVVTSQNFGSATIGSAPVTMTLNYPADATSPGASSVVPGGGVAPGSATDYIFFGNSNVEFGQGPGGQPTDLTNFTVSTLNNVEYPGNGNYTKITAPGGNSAFTTGTVTENPTNYPNTTPHTTLLATFSPLHAGSFTVYILDGNTDGIYVGNSSVGLGVNGGAAVVTASHYLSGTNEFTRYNVANASPSDVFQVYATTSTNSYPSIGGLTFVMGTSSGGLTAATTANQDFQVSSSNCSGGTCSVQVTFTPAYPGLRYDALTLTDSNGNMVYQTYLYGVGMGPQFGYEIGNYTEYDGFLTSPLGVTIGPDDFVYFTQTNSNVITRYSRDFNNSNQITLNGLATPSGIAVDGSNTLYVADQTNNVIISYSAAGVQGTVTTSPLNGPSQLAIDGTGALYIADTGNGRIIKIDNQGNETTIASGLSSPTAVAVDSNGNVFFADSANNGEILELAAGGSSPTTYTSQMFLAVKNMALDASESIYVTTDQGLAFYRNGSQDGLFYATGGDVPYGLAVERNGDVFQTNPLKDKFSMNDRSSSNFILNTPPNTTTNGSYPIYNTGNTPLTITGLSTTGPEFQIANAPPQCTPPQILAPATSCNVTINFTPPLAQYYTDTAIATSNSLNRPGTTDPFYLAGSGTGAPSVTTVSAAPSEVQSGSPVELLVTVSDSPMTFTPSGPVTFMDGSTVLGTATLAPGVLADTATATFTTSTLSLGTHNITAVFPGDANVSNSTSGAITVTVGSTNYLPSGLPPTNSNGQSSVVMQYLGSVAVGSSQYVVLNQSFGGSQSVTATGTEFSIGGTQCGTGGCFIGVNFAPAAPGLRSGVVILRDGNGNVTEKYYLTGTGTGPQLGFDPGTDDVFSQTIITPTAVTYGQDGNLYIADASTNQVYNAQQAAGGNGYGPSSIALPIVNLGVIGGIAVDDSQQVFVTDQTNNLIVTYDQLTQVQSSVGTDQLSSPGGIVVDGSGDLYVADVGNNRIIKIDNLGNETTVAANIPATLGPIALDSAGNLYYAVTASPGGITEIPVGGGSPITIANNIGAIHGLAVDAAGRVYYTNDSGLSIFPVSNCGSFCNLEGLPIAGLPAQAIMGLALDPAGDIFLTQPGSGEYVESVRSIGNTLVTGPAGSTTPGAPYLVSNTGNMALTISNIAFIATQFFHADESSTCANGSVLAAGQLCSTIPDFTPPQAQPYNTPVIYTSNSLNANQATAAYYVYGDGTPASGGPGTTTLALSPTGSISLGDTLTLSATVAGVTSAAPTGTVNFLSNGVAIASGTLVANGSGSTASVVVTDSSLAVGTYNITAMYVGDSNNPSSSSAAQSINVTQGTPSITVSGQSSITVGQSEMLTASISSLASTAPTGTVSFFDGDNRLGQVSVTQTSTGGTATLTVNTLSVGMHLITAQYSGDSDYFSANSSPFTVTVGASVNSMNFGSVAVGSSSNSMTLTFPVTGQYSSFTSVNSVEFNISNSNCDSTCTATVTFNPQFPGLRYGAISLVDNQGNLIAKTYVYGTGQAPQFAFDPGLGSSPYTASNPVGLAVGPDGSVYVGDENSSTVTVYATNGESANIPLGNIGSVGAIAVDGSNTVYVVDNENDVIVSSNAAGVVSTVATSSPLGYPDAIAVDGTGALYIDDTENERILKIDNQGNQTTLRSGTNNSRGMAVDAAGDVFYTDTIDDEGVIYELPANGSAQITIASGLVNDITSLALDAAGRLYFLGYTNANCTTIASVYYLTRGGMPVAYPLNSEDGSGPVSLAIDSMGDVLVGNSNTQSVQEFVRAVDNASVATAVGTTTSAVATISNTGNTPLTISALSLSNNFTIDPATTCPGTVLAPGAVCTVTVDFSPTAIQNYTGILTVFANSLNAGMTQNQFTIYGQVTGSGGGTTPITFMLSVAPNAVQVGSPVRLFATVADTIGYTANGTVTFMDGSTVLGTANLSAVTNNGVSTAEFTATSLAVGTHTITASYPGDSTVTAGTSNSQTVTVTSGPPAPGPSVSVTAQNFGNVAVGSQSSMTFSLAIGDAQVGDLQVTVATDFLSTYPSCNAGTCTVTVTFTPLYPGLRQDTVNLIDNNSNVLATTYVYGNGTGPQLGFDSGNVNLNTGLKQPVSVAIGPDTFAYVADGATKQVYSVNKNLASLGIQNLGTPVGMAVDGSQTLYVVDQTNKDIVTFNLLTQVQGIVAVNTIPLNAPGFLAVDGAGSLYVTDNNIADNGGGKVYRIDNQGNQFTIAGGLVAPSGIAVDAAGDVFVADAGNSGEVTEIPANDGNDITIATHLGTVAGIALDASGKIYVGTDSGLKVIENGQSSAYPLAELSGQVTGVALRANGDIFVAAPAAGEFAQSTRSFARPFGVDGLGNNTSSIPPNSLLDGDPSDGYIVNQPFNGTSRVTYYSFYAGQSGTITPALFVKNPDGSFTLTGLGTARTNTQTGQLTYHFGLVAGTDITTPSTYFGFFNTNGSNVDYTFQEKLDTLTIASPGYTADSIGATYTPDGGMSFQNVGGLSPRDYSINVTTAAGTTTTSTGVFPLMATIGASAQQAPLAVTNTGNAALTISSLAFSGNIFSLDSTSTCAAGTTLTAGGSCNTVVDFQPAAAQNYHEELTYTSNTLNVPGSINTLDQYGTGTTGTSPSTTTLAVSSNNVTVGQPVTLTAVVSVSIATAPTGTVNFLDGTMVIGSTAVGSGGIAQFTTSMLTAGSHSITATYTGDSNFGPSTSAAQTVNVAEISTTTTLAISAANITPGQTETLTATIVGGSSPAMTGNVTFYDNDGILSSVPITDTATGGTATLQVSTLTLGTHQLVASYNGDSNYVQSFSSAQTVTVSNAPAAATTISFFTSAGTPTAYGYPFELVATVTATATGAPATPGQVIFCDASLPRCNLLSNLGIAQTNSAGRATLPIYAGIIGNHTYKAVFLGTTSFQGTTSTTQQVTIAGTYPSITSIASSGSVGNYTLTGTVEGLGSRTLRPTGSVSFMDNSDSQTLGTANLGTAMLGFAEVQPTGSPVAVGSLPYGVAAADLNGDGFVDIVTGNYGSSSISVAFGLGNGTFLPPATYAVGGDPERVLIADFNGDGYPDLVVANTGNGTVSVLLNRGDGTFQAQATYPVSSPVGLGVMDINHDGIADIVASDYYSNTLSVLIGNGDGTFKAAVTYETGGTPQTLAEGDFNGDGNIDLVVGNLHDNTVGVYLGNGDGTFQSAVTYAVGSGPQGVQVGDFNGDGIADLAVTNSAANTVSVLIGKGDGTFLPQVTYPVGGGPVGLVIADFNGDGYQDISVDNTSSNSQSILLGNGDGTFQPQITFATGNFPYGVAVGDFNGDGYPDMVVSDFSDNTAAILLSQISQSATGTITGVAVSGTPAGAHTVEAVYAGDTNFLTSTSTTILLNQGGNPGEIITGVAFTGSPANPTITISGSGFNPEPTGDNEPMSFYGQTGQDFGANGLYIMVSGSFAAGQDGDAIGLINLSYTDTLISFQLGSDYPAEFANALAEGDSFTVGVDGLTFNGTVHYPVLTPQTITFPSIPNHMYGDAPFALGATASSGLPVSYTVTSGPATVSGSTVTITGVGMVTIQATQAGNSTYAAATPVSQSFTVAQASQTITFPSIPNQTTTAAPFSLNATASSGLTVSYTVTSGPATVSGSTVTLTGSTGTVVIQATQAGNTNYVAATPVSQSFTVSVATGAATTITLTTNAGTGVAYEKPVKLTATVTTLAGGPVTVGQVIFCNAQAAYCNLNANLGIAQLNSSGVAILSVGSGAVGPHGFTAEFLGTTGFQASASVPQLVTVTGIYPTTTTIASTGSAGNYTLTGTVAGVGSTTLSPTGSVSFIDTTNGNATLGTAALGTATPGYIDLQSSHIGLAGDPQGSATADVNGDGFVDLVLTVQGYTGTGEVSVLLGNGDGTLQNPVNYTVGTVPVAVKIADFNGDGIPDLAVVNQNSQSVSVLLGNGNGTFKPQVMYGVGDVPNSLAVMDLNHDGIPDIVVSNNDSDSVSVLIGNGDGTFQTAVPYTTPTPPASLAEGDFNGDGKVDLAVVVAAAAGLPPAVEIYLGNGDGTFQSPVPYAISNGGNVVQVGDFNGDGKADLAVSDSFDGTVNVLLGNGDGTFRTQVPYFVGVGPNSLVIGDFNGDGKQDIAVAASNTFNSGMLAILSGNGDGTFQSAQDYQILPNFGLSVGDFNGDGYPDFATSNLLSSNGTVDILLSQNLQTATATITGVALSGSAGLHNVDAVYAGDSNFKTSTSSAISLTRLGSQTITFPSIPNQIYGNAPFTLNATASSGLSVSYAVTSGPATVSGSTVTLTGTGTVVIQATQAGNSSYAAATPVSQSFTVAAASQTITFPSIPNHTTTDAPFTLGATASSGLTVSYAVVSGPATVSGSTVTLTGSTGTVVIQAMQAGNTNYAAATPVSQSFTVSVATGAATTISLTTNAGSGVAYGTPFKLTASVTTAIGGPVTVGQVIFCSATAAYCNLNENLGVAQLNSSGVAVLSVGSGAVGSHSYIAEFLGTTAYLAATSSAQTVTVTDPIVYSTTTTITSMGSVGNYTLTGTVASIGSTTLTPTGSVSFVDTTNGNAVLGSASLGSATAVYSQIQSSQPITSNNPGAVATGDFNGDGFIDIVTADAGANEITVLLGNGDGTFQADANYVVGNVPDAVMVADFNGDGILDIVLANQNDQTVGVLLGNGDGTFKPQVTYTVGSDPASLAVMDLNHDGIADIVALNYLSGSVSVLIGNGDGTFQPKVDYSTARDPESIAEGDFNGDGNVDLAVTFPNSGTVGILLGNGDGTFKPQVTYAAGTGVEANVVQVGDFNGDGKADLAVSNYGGGTVSILLGNGDGTFQAPVAYVVGNGPGSLTIADFNADGKQDIAVANSTDLTVSFLLGNGDGTFTLAPQLTFSATAILGAGLAAADFNGDGLPDLTVSNYSSSGSETVRLSQLTQTATATITGIALGGSAGPHNVDAVYAGNSSFKTSTSSPISLTSLGSGPAAQTITFPSIPNQTYGNAPFTLNATASSGLPVSYAVTSGPATVSGSVVTLTGAGSVTIQATQAGNTNYAAATPVSQTFTVAQASQTITFATIPDHTVTDAPFSLNATASSGLAVSYTVTSGPATIAGSTVILTGAGTVVIQATQAGNTNYFAATPVSRSFTVSLASQIITFPAIPNHTFGDAPFTLNATASSGLGVSYTVTSGSATVSGNTVTLTGAGTVTIQANQAGNTTYAAATPVSQSFTVATESQTITFPAIPNHAATDPPFTLNATASSGLTVIYVVTSGPATVSGNTVTLTGTGTVVILASQAGNTNFAAATSVSQSFVVAAASQTITFPAIPNHTFGDAPFTLNATASSNLTVTYAVTSGPATVAGSTVTLTGAGTVVIQATQAGNTTYAAATPVSQSFVVLPAAPTLISITPPSGVLNSGATTITLTGSNFVATDIVQLNGAALASTYVNATTLTAIIPASFFTTAGTGQVTVVDSSGRTTTSQTFTVVMAPAINFSGPATTTSAAQPALTFQLVNPYPLPISGTLTLTFTPSGANGVDDPAVQFSSGGRTMSFTIPALSTVTPTVQIQTGTVAGTATITLLVTSNGVNVTPANVTPVQITIAAAPPTITTSAITRSGNSLSVSVEGFSNTRELSMATFHFTAVPGSTISTPDITAPVGTVFGNYFSSTASAGYGSTFLYIQAFNLNNDASSIQSVTVTLVNSQGDSMVSTAQ